MMHHGNHEQLYCSQETNSLRLQNLRSYIQQIASHLSDPDYDLYMEYNDDSHYLCAHASHILARCSSNCIAHL